MDDLERDQEEVVLMRNQKPIARLVPESPQRNALEVLGDLYRTLDDKTADALFEAINRAKKGKNKTLKALRNPWDS